MFFFIPLFSFGLFILVFRPFFLFLLFYTILKFVLDKKLDHFITFYFKRFLYLQNFPFSFSLYRSWLWLHYPVRERKDRLWRLKSMKRQHLRLVTSKNLRTFNPNPSFSLHLVEDEIKKDFAKYFSSKKKKSLSLLNC